jgi:hypothetical protein
MSVRFFLPSRESAEYVAVSTSTRPAVKESKRLDNSHENIGSNRVYSTKS